jgi:hypothetical protein
LFGDPFIDQEVGFRIGGTRVTLQVRLLSDYQVGPAVVDADNDLSEADLVLQEAKKNPAAKEAKRRRIQERIAAGLLLDEADVTGADEPSFNPFPEDNHSGMSHVVWYDGIVGSLRKPIDAHLPHPRLAKEKDRPKADESTFYISRQQIFGEVFKVKRGKEKSGPGISTLVYLMETKL